MLVTPEEIAALRARHPIVDVLARFGVVLPDRWNGSSDFMVSCPCPTHVDSTPSCIVHPSTDRYYCFGCGARGDVLQLVRDIEGIRSLREAVEFLDTGRLGSGSTYVPSRPVESERGTMLDVTDRPHSARTSLARVLEVNAEAWRALTADHAAERARRYLAGRGIDVRTLERRVGHPLAGYTPASRTGLVDHLRADGYGDDEIVDAGWGKRRDGVLTDRFRRRVVLPIRDIEGRVVGAAARDITGTARLKYLNTPTTIAFHKGVCLYRPTTTPITEASTVIICEGTLDALAIATQAAAIGLDRQVVPVAPSGTALTPLQAEMIAAVLPTEIIVCADGDQAGRNAAARWRDLLLVAGAGTRPRVVQLPANHDPASYLETSDADGLRAILAVVPSNVIDM